MSKITKKILLFAAFVTLFSACNTTSDKKEFKENKSGSTDQQMFLIGNGPNSKRTITDLIEKSGIRTGGYVVIILTSFIANNSTAYFLEQEFFEQNIMAVHTLNFLPDSPKEPNLTFIKNSDVLAIENASIICLLGEKNDRFIKTANNTRLLKSLLKAKKNGTLITGIGNGASIIGQYYFDRVKDNKTQHVKVVLKPGLGLLKNTVIDDITFLRNYKQGIKTESAKNNFVFIGLGIRAAIWIKNDDATVLRKSEISLIYPDKQIQTLGKDGEFILMNNN